MTKSSTITDRLISKRSEVATTVRICRREDSNSFLATEIPTTMGMANSLTKVEHMPVIEGLIYESKPYVLLALAIYALSTSSTDPTLLVCGLLLLFCTTVILRMRLKNRRGSPLETFVYEAQPFFYLALGAYVIFFRHASKLGVGFALLLLFCGGTILKWRMRRRK